MNHKKKYLKYKQKYLYLKNQHGGVLLNDITNLVTIIKELQDYGFQLEKDINCKLEEVIISVKEFHRSKMKEKKEEKQRQEQLLQQSKLRDLPIEIIRMLWVLFYKTLCDTITTYHSSLNYLHDNLDELTNNFHQKLKEVNQLLIEKWDYYLPPLLSDIKFSDSKLKKEMLISLKQYEMGDPYVEPQYGYIHPLELKDGIVHKHTYQNLIDEYRRNNECHGYFNDFNIEHENTLEGIDIAVLLNNTFEGKKYAEILQLEGFFINFKPEIKNYIVPIDRL